MPVPGASVCYDWVVQLFTTSATGRLGAGALGATAAGGVVGATLRWAVAQPFDVPPASWPWPTLLVNVVGCLLIGIAVVVVERESRAWDFSVTGVLGGFTTMSSFAVELNHLVDAERATLAIGYGTVTLVLGVAAVEAGRRLGAAVAPT